MQVFKTTYKDAKGIVDTQILNEFEEDNPFSLKMSINDVDFMGSSFDDFELLDKDKYNSEHLERFTLNKIKIYNSEEFVLELCNCMLNIEIPLKLIKVSDNNILETLLKINLELGKPVENRGIEYELGEFVIKIEGDKYVAKADMFEDAFDDLKKQFNDKYAFKNCYGCMYGDYSPYGNGFFGTMQCFKKHKEEYLAVESKRDILELADNGFLTVQETYCCDEFEIRESGVGYR